ncbi:MAG: hypothetical protein A2X94_06160 [Bdellovibrionales bacterium GWB1_55_8]|nr:MAG: hypothetical protein A2X94_06160 [Bdellovibrionales bacterium GWB1_55_8]
MFPPLPSRSRRNIFSLQLTAMIDVFALIIIYLVKGTFFGVSDVQIPKDLHLPTSFSKEAVETAPSAVIGGGEVRISMIPRGIALPLFDPNAKDQNGVRALRQELKTVVANLPSHALKSGVLLSVVADAETPYRDIFNVVKVMRESGFEAMLFIASGPGG